jgi:hypothetical protein
MSVRIFIPRDAAAIACGAEDVVKAVAAAAKKAKIDVTIVRNGSRGMLWLEPLMEIEEKGTRFAFGPMTPADSEKIVAALAKSGAAKIKHPRTRANRRDPLLREANATNIRALRAHRSCLAVRLHGPRWL